MGGEDVAILAIIFGSVVSIVFIATLGGIIKAAIKRKSSSNISENKEFLAALREFKEKTDRRLQNLEAIVSGDDPIPLNEGNKRREEKKEERKSAIEIEIEDHNKKDTSQRTDSGKLKNMLNQ